MFLKFNLIIVKEKNYSSHFLLTLKIIYNQGKIRTIKNLCSHIWDKIIFINVKNIHHKSMWKKYNTDKQHRSILTLFYILKTIFINHFQSAFLHLWYICKLFWLCFLRQYILNIDFLNIWHIYFISLSILMHLHF